MSSSSETKKIHDNLTGRIDDDSDECSISDEEGNFMGWDHSKREKRRRENLRSKRRNQSQNMNNSQKNNEKKSSSTQKTDAMSASFTSFKSDHLETFDEADDEAESLYNDSSGDDSDSDSGEELENDSTSYTTDSDDDDESLDDEDNSNSNSGWSVRVRLLEVENIPSLLSSSTPFCPVIKFGLISSIKQTVTLDESLLNDNNDDKNQYQLLSVDRKLERFGLAKIKDSRGRCSSSSITPVKDKSKFQWYEEFRWDSVSRPLQTMLAIELCGKSIFNTNISPDSNTKETNIKNGQLDEDSNQRIQNERIERSNSLTSFFRRGRRRPLLRTSTGGIPATSALVNPAEMERGNASAKLAQFLVQQSPRVEENGEKISEEDTPNTIFKINLSEELEEKNEETALELVQSSNDTSAYTSDNMIENETFREDFQLGHLLVPLSQLPLEDATRIGGEKRQYAVTDQWYQVNISSGKNSKNIRTKSPPKSPFRYSSKSSPQTPERKRKSIEPSQCPRIRLEISFAATTSLDESEDDFTDDEEDDEGDASTIMGDSSTILGDASTITGRDNDNFSASICSTSSRRSTIKDRVRKSVSRSKKTSMMSASSSVEPEIQPGIVDFITVLGAKDIGDLKEDDGTFGWVKSNPECAILEQFPKDDQFHMNNGRSAALPNKVEWFCFPEGCSLWRGVDPPTAKDLQNLNSVRSSSSLASLPQTSPNINHNISFSNPAFDQCLNCATSFGWFVISSTSENYGSESMKTFGAVIRFYAPAPCGIDPTQDDFAQTGGSSIYLNESATNSSSVDSSSSDRRRRSSVLKRVRFWVPMGICMTSSFPIIGILEAILLRICQTLGSREFNGRILHENIANLIINYQAPIPGVLHCSIPFLQGPRYHVTLAPPTGLPSLPHGGCITAVCKLIGAKGLVTLLSALLTECKVLLHSNDVSNLPMVGEVITALMFPFVWELPYIPVLPEAMLEFVEAPMSYLVGIPTCAVRWIDPEVLYDVVVVDLNANKGLTENGRGKNHKNPSLLPKHISAGISNEVLKLLKEAEEVELQHDDHDDTFADGGIHLPRLELEDLAEREFRISISLHISSLLRGYHDCLFFVSSSQPVFNRERFLRTGDALFEEKIDSNGIVHRVVSQRSKSFLLPLVNTQSFHCLLERMYSDSEDRSFFPFFHDIMDALDLNNENRGEESSMMQKFTQTTINQINTALQKIEDAIPTYRVNQNISGESSMESVFDDSHHSHHIGIGRVFFTSHMLRPIVAMPQSSFQDNERRGSTKSLSLRFLVEIEKNPWEYTALFNISGGMSGSRIQPKVTIRSAIGEGRYRAYLASKKNLTSSSNGADKPNMNNLLMNNLLTSAKDEIEKMDTTKSESKSTKDAEDRETLRKCLERAIGGSQRRVSVDSSTFFENGRDLIQDAEIALQNPSAQVFLLSLLSQRARLEKQRQRRQSTGLRRNQMQNNGTSRILSSAFDCLVRLCNAMLGATMAEQDYESSYRLLTHTYGFCTVLQVPGAREKKLMYMTAKIGMHPVFTDLSLWERVIEIHLEESSRGNIRIESQTGMAEYDATVTTIYEMIGYGVPTEELVRFVTRVSNARGFFSNEKAQSLLSLVRKLSMKRDNEVSDNSSIITNNVPSNASNAARRRSSTSTIISDIPEAMTDTNREIEKTGIAWFHPTATKYEMSLNDFDNMSIGNIVTSRIAKAIGQQLDTRASGHQDSIKNNVLDPTGFYGKNSITAATCFGATAIVTGSLDGGVFLTHSISRKEVRGVRLEWGNNAKGVGPVTCLASVRAAQQAEEGSSDSYLSGMDGCRVVAGSAGGELNVWSLKDVVSQIIENEDHEDYKPLNQLHLNTANTPDEITKQNRIDLALKGHWLSGHTGGVSCLDVPSTVYRPDSLVSGGEDGLIKLWSLRTTNSFLPEETVKRSRRPSFFFGVKPFLQSEEISGERGSIGNAKAVLTGHEGRVLCVKTAWHGDRVLSGGIDGKVMLWDLAGGDGKCLQEMIGHTLWVTHAQYWGPHTIVSASTDRSIALWDARVANDPLFILRHHNSHVSDIMVGPRAESLMVTAGGDGTLATWDLRIMTSSRENLKGGKGVRTKTNRQPVASMNHSEGKHCTGSIKLARGASSQDKSVLSAGTDGIIKEWDIATGKNLGEEFIGHNDGISCLTSFSEDEGLQANRRESTRHERDSSRVCGIISCSWDGSVRLRRVLTNYDNNI